MSGYMNDLLALQSFTYDDDDDDDDESAAPLEKETETKTIVERKLSNGLGAGEYARYYLLFAQAPLNFILLTTL